MYSTSSLSPILKVDDAKRVHEWHPKPMDVHEHFIWDPYTIYLENATGIFSKSEKIFRKAAKQLLRSGKIVHYKPEFEKRQELLLKEAIRELHRSVRIVDYCPFLYTRTPTGCTCSRPATRRLLNLLSAWYGFDINKIEREKLPGEQVITWKERQQNLRQQRGFALKQMKLISHSMQAFYRMMKWIDRENLREQKCFAEKRMNLINRSMQAFNCMMKRIERARLELERVRLKVERIRQERRFYKQILSCNQKYGNRWVEPTKKALEVLPFRVKTYPWKVLSVHERTIVVEQVSKVGTTYPVTYHKSFMQDIITKETLL